MRVRVPIGMAGADGGAGAAAAAAYAVLPPAAAADPCNDDGCEPQNGVVKELFFPPSGGVFDESRQL